MTNTKPQHQHLISILDLAQKRNTVQATLSVDAIQHMSLDDLHKLQQLLMLGDCLGCPVIPEAWMPSGSSQAPGARTINFRKRLVKSGCPLEQLDGAILTMMRISMLFWVSPSSTERGLILLKPHSWMFVIVRITRLVASVLAKAGSFSENIFANVSKDDVDRMDLTPKSKQLMLHELKRISGYAHRGLWQGAPVIGGAKINGLEASRLGNVVGQIEELQPNPIKPLPDDFVAQAGWRFVWISANLGPNLLRVLSEVRDVFQEFPLTHTKAGRLGGVKIRSRRVRKLLTDFEWVAQDGSPLRELPFDYRLLGRGGGAGLGKGESRKKGATFKNRVKKEQMQWPPSQWSHVLVLLQLLQTAHLSIFLLSVGSRVSEAMSLKSDCLVPSTDGITLADGLTYKLSGKMFEGESRSWALPELALQALKLQQKLVTLLSEMGGLRQDLQPVDADVIKSLWLQIGKFDTALLGTVNANMNRMVTTLQLNELLQNERIGPHRFRKTIARLIALALVGAPKILMDLFGHKSIEMTLHYILSDPLVRSEMDEVAKAQTIMFVEDAIENIDHCGGKAAKRLRPLVMAERIRHGNQCESPRILRRLQPLRRWSHEQEVKQIFPGSARTGGTHGARTPRRVPIPVGRH